MYKDVALAYIRECMHKVCERKRILNNEKTSMLSTYFYDDALYVGKEIHLLEQTKMMYLATIKNLKD